MIGKFLLMLFFFLIKNSLFSQDSLIINSVEINGSHYEDKYTKFLIYKYENKLKILSMIDTTEFIEIGYLYDAYSQPEDKDSFRIQNLITTDFHLNRGTSDAILNEIHKISMCRGFGLQIFYSKKYNVSYEKFDDEEIAIIDEETQLKKIRISNHHQNIVLMNQIFLERRSKKNR